MFSRLDAHEIIPALALLLLGFLATLLVFRVVPSSNSNEIIFCLGAISGALGVPQSQKVMNGLQAKLTSGDATSSASLTPAPTEPETPAQP